ncbi:MAG: MFS transporter, partial [Chloroflexota bacterium]
MAKPADSTTSKNTVLLIATIGSFFTPFMVSAINIALPPIGREFSMNVVLLSWVATSYNLAAAAFLLPFGRLGDIWGRKKVYTIGMIIYAAASLLAGLSGSGIALIAFRVLQGIGSALIFGTGVAILISVFPASERGKVLGINVTATYLGLSLGPFIGGLLTQHLGWRSIFFVNVPLAFLTIALIFWKLKGEWAEARGESFDLTGSLVFGLSLSVMMYGLTLLPVSLGIWLVLAGALGIFVFIKWEGRVSSPVLNIRLFTDNIAFAFSNLAALINYSATFAVGFLLSLYLQYVKGFAPEHAGLVLIAQPVMQVICSPVAGSLSDRIEPRIVSSVGMALTTLGLVLLTFLSNDTGLIFILVCL